jgi:outer membrane protein OmpA-like peptidoglycan-associated protein
LKPVFFATNKDVILPKSFPVLQAVANALAVETNIKHISIEGHTDNRGKPDANRDLSERRAKSVMKWLIEHQVAAERLEAHGFGPDRPIDTNKTSAGRAANRRVEFRIIEPATPSAPSPTAPAPSPTAPEAPPQSTPAAPPPAPPK